MRVVADNYMIQNTDLHRLSHLFELARKLPILMAWCRNTWRMIMHANDWGGEVLQRLLEDLADDGGGEAAICVAHVAEGFEFVKDLAGQIYGGLAFDAGAQEDGEEFSVG